MIASRRKISLHAVFIKITFQLIGEGVPGVEFNVPIYKHLKKSSLSTDYDALINKASVLFQ
jgi:hypothetical protein